MPRAKLIQEKGDVSPEYHALFDELAALRGRISGPSTIILHSPQIAGRWNDVGEYLHRKSIVEPLLAEIAVCATAREYDCPFVWASHIPLVEKAGGSRKTLDIIRDRGGIEGLAPEEARVVSYARQLLQTNRVDSDLFEALVQEHGIRWLVELTVWIGRYAALAGVLNTFELPPAAEPDPLPEQPAPARSAARGVLSAPRVTPITERGQVAETDVTFFDGVAEHSGGVVRGPMSILMYSPELCKAMFAVTEYLRHESSLSPAHRAIATLSVARAKDCNFVWALHAAAARNAGVDETAINALRQSAAVEGLPAADAAVVEYVRQMLGPHRVTQALFDELREGHGLAWLVDLTALVGHYGILTAVLNAFEVAPAAGMEELI